MKSPMSTILAVTALAMATAPLQAQESHPGLDPWTVYDTSRGATMNLGKQSGVAERVSWDGII
jgi:hypothetical protein